MKTLLSFLLIAVSLTASTVKVSYTDANNLVASLSALDGSTKLDASNHPVVVAYDFGGPTRLHIAKDIQALREALAPYQEAAKGLMKAEGVADVSKASKDQVEKINAEWAKTIAAPLSVNLDTITSDELKLDTNSIPGTVIAGLSPILK